MLYLEFFFDQTTENCLRSHVHAFQNWSGAPRVINKCSAEHFVTRSGTCLSTTSSADLLYEVINRRYERKPVILTTNRPFKEWNEVFPNAACIVTLLDRLLHHADAIKIEGDSYRVRESEQETAARRRKK